ncbi:MAG: hypothetical protein HFI34_05960 [Lachnospiraceae bacterium]|nr:hypothetical protein [Lachnospiraceae bacterium]
MSYENKWKEEFEYDERFIARYKKLIGMLDGVPFSSVLDLGCGVQYLKYIIPDEVYYTGVDLYKHKEDTLICDFNKKEFVYELDAYDLTISAGVLEYIYEIPDFIHNISCITTAFYLCSYHFREFTKYKPDIWTDTLLSFREFVEIAEKENFVLVKAITKANDRDDNRATLMLFEKR